MERAESSPQAGTEFSGISSDEGHRAGFKRNLNSMLNWAGEEPANPGVTGNQNSDTPTCAYSVIWDVRSSVKIGNGA